MFRTEKKIQISSAESLSHTSEEMPFSVYLQNSNKNTYITGVVCGLKEVTYEKYQQRIWAPYHPYHAKFSKFYNM